MESRTKNASRNIFFGVILKAYQILVAFFIRTAMIYLMGVEYLGLNSLFTSILQVLNLAELGVGSAMIYCMYRPIAENNGLKICSLLKLYKIYYRIIGIIIAVVGISLTPFIPRLISGDVPRGINIYILYLLNLAATVLSYWLFAYKNSLLQAFQRADIVSKVTLITSTIQYGLQILVLWLFHDYYMFIIIMLMSQVLNNIVIAAVANKMYPNFQPTGDVSKSARKEISEKIRDLFTAKLGTVFSTSVDSVVVSASLGLTILAIYQNYFYIMNAIVGILLVLFNSITAGIGNSLITESIDKNYDNFRKFAFLTIWICVVCISCFICLYQPFMIMWVGKDLLLPDLMVIFLAIYFYVYVVQSFSCIYKDAAGIWHQDRFRPIIAGIINLILNISLVKVWGIYAIVLSTIISYVLVAMPWVVANLFKLVFKRNPCGYIVEMIIGLISAAVCSTVCYGICAFIPGEGIFSFLVKGFLTIIVSNVIYILMRRKNRYFNSSIDLIDSVTKYKLIKITKIIRNKE